MHAGSQPAVTDACLDILMQRYRAVRAETTRLIEPLSAEDCALQSMPEASPAKWHLGHTSWFFEQFVLRQFQPERPWLHAGWDYLFNSYYQSVGPMHARPQRGLLSRPSLQEVLNYRQQIDQALLELCQVTQAPEQLSPLIELGLQHEQQHQELLLTDILHLLSCNPLRPAYQSEPPVIGPAALDALRWVAGEAGLQSFGYVGSGFAYDNELPRHSHWLPPHALADRLISNAEYRQFVEDGGYQCEGLWLSEGWARCQREAWQRPMYWNADLASTFSLYGERGIDDAAPVCHISYFEADAFARWAGARLPSEFEWESMASKQSVQGRFRQDGVLIAQAAAPGDGCRQMFGDCWEWTASPYVGFPGFKPLGGSLGEYNGKFMCGQWVLRGGSCASPADHLRASYRNFFYPADRWQFMGLRLAKDLT